MFLTLLIPLLSSLFGTNGPLGQYLKTKADQVQAKAALDLKVENDKFLLSGQIAQAAVDLQRAQLAATSSLFKSTVFWIFTAPILATMIHPAWGTAIFIALNTVPADYLKMYFLLIGVIWGIPMGTNMMGGIMTGLQSAFDASHQRKIEKISALGEATGMNLEQAKAQIFDIMKQTVHLNGYTQGQVDAISKVIDPILSSRASDTTVNVGGQNGQ
jgi:hypothetical protein